MRVAIVGSRDFENLWLVTQWILDHDEKGLEVVSGGARGVDQQAEKICRYYGIPIYVFKPEWDALGKIAGFVRNQQIVDYADRLVAFWDGKSRGTADSIRRAKKKGIPVEVVYDQVDQE